ncbi:hypothetical protein ACDY96_25925 [Rhizobium mongolense]|uniref:hypothetical protein n=1 Tax=Rhizobium mongolense TaxID=57676 RepID=UPI0035568C21
MNDKRINAMADFVFEILESDLKAGAETMKARISDGLNERFDKVPFQEIERAIELGLKRHKVCHDVRQANAKAEMETMNLCIMLMERFPAETFGESVKRGVAAGDALAMEVHLDMLNRGFYELSENPRKG